ncbi:MAG: hypothetical protein ACREEY_06220 [Brevundimonas sp.]
MSQGILSKLIKEIGEADDESRAENYAMVNVRPGDKVASMLEIVSKLSGRSPSSLVTDQISLRLARYAASSSENADVILDAAEEALEGDRSRGFQAGSSLDMLERAGIIEVKRPARSIFK